MPQQILKPCRKSGCRAVTLNGYCNKHLSSAPKRNYQREYSKRNHKFNKLYNHKWAKARKAFLQEHPLCVRCSKVNQLTSSFIVDHIQPHRGDLALFWDQSNWQPLCKPCHDAKTAHEDRQK